MQVERLVAPHRDAVHIHAHQHAHQRRLRIRAQDGAGLLNHFAASRVSDGKIVRFDVASGKQPALQAAVQHQQDAILAGAEHQTGAGDVPRIELAPRKRLRRGSEQRQGQFPAFGSLSVVACVEAAQQGGDGLGFDHSSIIAPWIPAFLTDRIRAEGRFKNQTDAAIFWLPFEADVKWIRERVCNAELRRVTVHRVEEEIGSFRDDRAGNLQ